MNISLSAFAPENLVSQDGFGSPVPRQPAHLHTQAEPGAYLRGSSRVPLSPYKQTKHSYYRTNHIFYNNRNLVPAFSSTSVFEKSTAVIGMTTNYGLSFYSSRRHRVIRQWEAPVEEDIRYQSGNVAGSGMDFPCFQVMVKKSHVRVCGVTVSIGVLAPPSRPTFQARLLHNQEGANAEKGDFRKISSRAFFGCIGRCSHSLGCGAIEPGKSV